MNSFLIKYKNAIIIKIEVLIFGILLYILFGCKSENKSSDWLSIDVEEAMRNEICPEVSIKSIIKLETNDSILIGKVTSIEFFSGRYFVFDRDLSKALFIFNSEGRFIAKTKYGKGPGEILAPWDFYIDKQKSQLLIWDQATFKMMVFDMNLNFVSAESHRLLAIRNFEFLGEDTAFVFAQSSIISEIKENTKSISYNYLVFTNNFNKVIQKISPELPGLVPISLNSPISNNNGILFIEPYNYFIYKLHNKSKVLPIYYLDFGKYSLSKDDIKRGLEWVSSKAMAGQKVISLDYILDNKRYMAVSFFYKTNYQCIIYSKFNNLTYHSSILFKNSILQICFLKGLSENSFIGVASPEDFIKYSSDNKKMEKILMPKLSDNPYLIVFSIND
jgi:hypothetical protein